MCNLNYSNNHPKKVGKEKASMYGVEQIIENIDLLIEKKKLNKTDKIFVFGYNNLAIGMINHLLDNGFHVDTILDNGKSGKAIHDINIEKPEDALTQYSENVKILISSAYFNDMKKQVLKIDKRYSGHIIQVSKIRSGVPLRNKIYSHFPNLYNDYLRIWEYRRFLHKNKIGAELLRRNKKLKDIHKGQRCFILGNGPSLNNVDFSKLKNEIIFGVNQIMEAKVFDNITLKYWVCTDPSFFGKTFDSIEGYYKKIEKLQGKVDKCFIRSDCKEYIQQHNLNKILNFYYIFAKLRYDSLDNNLKLPNEIEMDKFTIIGWLVVINCIQIAIYMGFSEIYLLGCDQTLAYYTMQELLEGNHEDYHTKMIDTEKDASRESISKKVKNLGLKRIVQEYMVSEKQFTILYQYCKKHDIKLCNLTEKSLIAGIPKENLNQII